MVLRERWEVVIPTGSSWRGLSIDVRAEDASVDAPTLGGEKPLILQKGVSLSNNYFLEMKFFFYRPG